MIRKLTVPRLLVGAIGALVLLNLAFTDKLAAAVAALGGLCTLLVVRHRSRGALRAAVVGLLVGATALGATVALALPTYRSAPDPLVVSRSSTPPAAPAGPRFSAASTRTGFEVLGFVSPDIDDSAAGVDRDVSKLSTLATTGFYLAANPGSLEVEAGTDTLVRAHLNGASGLMVISNWDGTNFSGDRAVRLMTSSDARGRFVSAVSSQIARGGWDGVLLDLEALPASVRGSYPVLVRDLVAALGNNHRVAVAVPAATSSDDPVEAAYDLPALGQAASQIVWMAYDEHALVDPSGPVASLPWVRQGLTLVEASVPRAKLLLGVPGYGYAWSGPGQATVVKAPAARDLAADPKAQATWDMTAGEWHVHTADGRELWYDDARSFEERARLALNDHLGGIALWRVGAEDPDSLSRLPAAPLKHPIAAPARPVQEVKANGLAAITFDDGPDPKWTPRILDVLQREHVPATFFIIGSEAERHPGLLRREVRNGYVVANHTYSHGDLSKMPAWRAKLEIIGNGALIEGITGAKPALFRSPYGSGDSAGGQAGGDAVAAGLGLHSVGWNDDPMDWQRPGIDIITRRALDHATERTVVLLHDGGGDRSQTLAALPRIIEGLRSRGFLFTTVDGLDASIRVPYVPRHGFASQARGLALIAGFRLQVAAWRITLELLVAMAIASMARLAFCIPLALSQARRARRRPPGPADEELSFSIVVPAHNEARVIEKTLAALERLTWGRYEVVVVDDGSTDDTAELAARYPVRLLRQPKSGKARALNAGVATATGDVVVVLDADTVLDPGFLDAIAPHFADPAVGAVAGNVKVGNRRSLLARLQALEYIVSLNLDRRAQARLNLISVVPGAAGAFRRRALLAVGGYPTETLVEDADLTVTLLRAGWKVPYEAAAVSWTEAPQRISAVLRQRRRWSYGTVEVVAKHADAMLHPAAGRVGLLGLPWMVLSQVLLPSAGPLVDLFLLYLLVTGATNVAFGILAVALAFDLVVSAACVVAEREDLSLILGVPLLRLIWRPLQLLAAFRSLGLWLRGTAESWRHIERYNTVEVAAAVEAGALSPPARNPPALKASTPGR